VGILYSKLLLRPKSSANCYSSLKKKDSAKKNYYFSEQTTESRMLEGVSGRKDFILTKDILFSRGFFSDLRRLIN
tara:strand:+ start:115 stop:339 length:225 start_codon:yes stop_codon:yes gene_type:complete